MGRNQLVLIFGLLLSGSVFAAEYYQVTAPSCLNARTNSNRRSNVVDCVPYNARVQIAGSPTRGGWVPVIVNGRKVYMHKKYLKSAPAVVTRPPVRPPAVMPSVTEPPVAGRPSEVISGVGPNDPIVTFPPGARPPVVIPPVVTRPDNPEVLTGGVTSPSGPSAGTGTDLYASALSVMSEGVIPPGTRYNIGSPNWPKIRTAGGKLAVDFGGRNKECMCTSGVATAIAKHFADLSNTGKLKLEAKHVEVLNSMTFHHAINGQFASTAGLFKELGGTAIKSGGGLGMNGVFAQAKRGDIMVIDRKNGSGHSTIFNEVRGGKACYWSCNQGSPKGPSERCESISSFSHIGITRFPQDLAGLPARLEALGSDRALTQAFRRSNSYPTRSVAWDSTLATPGNRQVAAAAAGEEAAR